MSQKGRNPNFTNTEKKLLARLILEVDKGQILFDPRRNAGLTEQKTAIWDWIVVAFNAGTSRIEHCDRLHLTRQYQKIKATSKTKSDEKNIKELSKFKASCSKTGGGRGDAPPEQFNPDLEEEEEQDDLLKVTNNVGPLKTIFDHSAEIGNPRSWLVNALEAAKKSPMTSCTTTSMPSSSMATITSSEVTVSPSPASVTPTTVEPMISSSTIASSMSSSTIVSSNLASTSSSSSSSPAPFSTF